MRSELPTVCDRSNCRREVHEERQTTTTANEGLQSVKCRQPTSSIKGIAIWKTKRVPRPGKSQEVFAAISGEVFEESVVSNFARKASVVCSEGQTCTVAGTERTGWRLVTKR